VEAKQLFVVVLVMSIVVVGVTGASLILNTPVDTPTNDTSTTTTTETDDIPFFFTRDQDLLPYNVTIPDWEFEMLDSDNVTMSDYQGKFVIMIFAATWCPACEYQNTDNVKMWNETSRSEVSFLQLTTAQGDSPQMLRDYIDDYGLKWNIGYATGDVGDAADDFLKLRYIPTLVIIDDSGTLRWIHEGTWRFIDFDATLSELMG